MGNSGSGPGADPAPFVPPAGLQEIDETYEKKMAIFESDCDDGKGEPLGCHHAAEYYAVVKEEYERAVKIYDKNCSDKEFAPSCFNLGRAYLIGRGVNQSDKACEQLFDKACKGGHLIACDHHATLLYSLALEPIEESDIPGEPEQLMQRAVDIYDKACSAGNTDSCHALGFHYVTKNKEWRDPVKALGYLETACNINHAPSCSVLSLLYKNGDKGINPDPEKEKKFKDRTKELIKAYAPPGATVKFD